MEVTVYLIRTLQSRIQNCMFYFQIPQCEWGFGYHQQKFKMFTYNIVVLNFRGLKWGWREPRPTKEEEELWNSWVPTIVEAQRVTKFRVLKVTTSNRGNFVMKVVIVTFSVKLPQTRFWKRVSCCVLLAPVLLCIVRYVAN